MAKAKSVLLKTVTLTTLALIAFAANSILCRLALGTGAIDAAGFTAIRLVSGAFVLLLILLFSRGGNKPTENTAGSGRGSLFATVMLFIYASTFSFAYITMDTGTGALILFGAVQLTMITASLIRGHRLSLPEWFGVALAFAGFVYLVLPGLSTPSLFGFVLMAFSGVAWGLYTLLGKGSADPLGDTAYNFIRTIPLVLVMLLVFMSHLDLSVQGVLLAVLSGAIASGVGYTIWYSVLKYLTATQAGVLQLSVPVIATIGGVIWMQEAVTLTLFISGSMILGGIFLVILGGRRQVKG